MSIVSGIDVGSRLTKAVIVDGKGRILGRGLTPTGAYLAKAADVSLDLALEDAGLTRDDVKYNATTGYGRYQVPFRQVQITDLTSHAVGVISQLPQVRFVVDIGAQSSRASRIRKTGQVERFKMNDKCAAGAGRFLERTAKALELEPDSIGELSLRARDPQEISSVCAVLAESEIINHVTEGATIEDILMGANLSIASRVGALVRQVGAKKEPEGIIAMTGGLGNNPGMVHAMKETLGKEVLVPKEPELMGALGAAILGLRRLSSRKAA